MGMPAGTALITLGHERPESPFRVIFQRAYSRIGRHWFIALIEVIGWSILAWRMGADYWGYHDEQIAMVMALVVFCIIMGAAPLFIGPIVYRVNGGRQELDDLIRLVPVSASTFILARLAAVGLLWLRIFGPLVLLIIHLVQVSQLGIPLIESMYYLGNPGQGQIYRGYDQNGPSHLVFNMLTPDYYVIRLVIIGWFALPITWAVYWSTRIRLNAFFFEVVYMLYPVILFLYGAGWRYLIFDPYGDTKPTEWWTWVSIMITSVFGLSLVLYRQACRYIGRRY